jgi:coproporphyrinogen III oxidase-like Fe-S oxidoreductase
VDTVYLGGGTPSLLAPELLQRFFAAMRSHFDLDPDAEITVECAPGQLADETLEALVVCGVNRVSLGVQSFIDREAASSGRLHNRAIVLADVMRLRAARISNLNIDLIAGLAGQTFASWQESLMVMTALADAGVPHASVYMLEVDEDSRLGATTPIWFPPTTPSRKCIRRPSKLCIRQVWSNMRSPTSAAPAFTRVTICATGSAAHTSALASTLLRCWH